MYRLFDHVWTPKQNSSGHFSPGPWKGLRIDSWDTQLHYLHATGCFSIAIGHRNSISNTETEVRQSL